MVGRHSLWSCCAVALAVSLMAGAAVPVLADEGEEDFMPEAGMVLPIGNAERGRDVFVGKGCIACHQVNGVGGTHGESFDEEEFRSPVNPFHMWAKMWEHAPEMIEEQVEDLGRQIELEARDLADIVAFLADDDMRGTVTAEMIPERFREVIEEEEAGEEKEEKSQ